MNDINPRYLVLLGGLTSLGALIAGATGALVVLTIVLLGTIALDMGSALL